MFRSRVARREEIHVPVLERSAQTTPRDHIRGPRRL